MTYTVLSGTLNPTQLNSIILALHNQILFIVNSSKAVYSYLFIYSYHCALTALLETLYVCTAITGPSCCVGGQCGRLRTVFITTVSYATASSV